MQDADVALAESHQGVHLPEEAVEIRTLAGRILDPVAVQPGEAEVGDMAVLGRKGKRQEQQEGQEQLSHCFMNCSTLSPGRVLRRV